MGLRAAELQAEIPTAVGVFNAVGERLDAFKHCEVVAAGTGGLAGKALLAAIGSAAEIGVLQAGELRGEELAGAGLDELLFGASLKLGDEVHTATAKLQKFCVHDS